MAVWDDFLSTIGSGVKTGLNAINPATPFIGTAKNVANVVGKLASTSAGEPIAKAIEGVGGAALTGVLGLPSRVLDSYTGAVAKAGTNIGVAQATKNLPISDIARQQIQDNIAFDIKKDVVSNDPLLKAGVFAVDKVISPYIARPISTVGLMTDVDSPLYQSGEYEQGFQLEDFKRAYNRSEKVSPFQALTKSDLIPLVQPFSQAVLSSGGIDLENVNLWNDEDIQKNFHDNVVGRWFTGLGDFTVLNYGIKGAVTAVAKTAGYGAKVTGLSTKHKTVEEFEKDINDGLLHKATNGAEGRFTTSADDIDAIAKSDDMNYILERSRVYSLNENLPDILLKTKNPATVRDAILADKGYIPALERLSATEPAALAEMIDLPGYISSLKYTTGKPFIPDETALTRLNAAWDDAISKNPEHVLLKEAFLDPAGNIKLLGNDKYFPMEPIIGSKIAGKALVYGTEVKAAAVSRNLDNIGGLSEITIGSGKLITTLVRAFGSRKPMGMVTVTGLRPLDGVDELNAFFDDTSLLTKTGGVVKVGATKTMTVPEYRNFWITKFASARNEMERYNVVDEFNDRFGLDMARSYGYTNVDQIIAFIAATKSELYGIHNGIAKTGYAYDNTGQRIIVDRAMTQRQFAESIRLIPFNIIEKDFIRASQNLGKSGAMKTAQTLEGLFEIGNKYWTFNVLGSPKYIAKNSIFEPVISATFSQGISFVTDNAATATKNIVLNNKNRIMEVASKMYRGPELKAVNKTVDELLEKLNTSYALLDEVTSEYSAFLDGTVSPAARAQNLPKVEADLKAARRLVENVESEVGAALRPMGFDIPEIPSIANLETRVQFLEKILKEEPNKSAQMAAPIANAKAAIGQAKGSIYSLVADFPTLEGINTKISQQYKEINDIIKGLGEARFEQAKVFGKSEAYKKRRYGKEKDFFAVVNGQYISIASLFDENNFGKAYRAELSNSKTVENTYLGESKIGVKQNIMLRRAPGQVTDISAPQYFEELAFIANRVHRGDKFSDLILAGTSEADLIKWALDNKSYVRSFGVEVDSQIPTFVRERVGNINRYFPNKEAQALILKQEVSSVDLQKILSKHMERLSPLHPNDFDYLNGTNPSSARGVKYFDEQFSKAAGAVWQKLTAPENPIRWAYADNYFIETMTRKANELAKQGVKLTTEQVNALRQAAARETVKQTESVFYTVRRQNRILYAARAVAAFPTASFNAVYRYGKMAINNPSRVGGFLYSYQGAYATFGVDKYGNPVTDPLKATHIIVPGTKELGFNDGKGIPLAARGFGFILNYASPAVWSSLPVGQVLKWKPTAEEQLIGVLGQETYDILFPYGPQKDIPSAFIPSWVKPLKFAIMGSESDKLYLNSFQSNWAMAMTKYDMGLAPAPTVESVEKQTRSTFFTKFKWAFASPFGIPAKVDTKPFAIFDDYYNILVNKHNKGYIDSKGVRHEPLNYEDAQDAAELEMIANIPEFPVYRARYKAGSKVVTIAPTIESIKRIYDENPELAKELASLQDPTVVGLLVADLERDPEKFSQSAYNYLSDPKTKLPGGFELNLPPKNVEQQEILLQKNRAWKRYTDMRDMYTKAALDRGFKSLRGDKELSAALENFANTELKEMSQAWWNEKQAGGVAEDNAFKQAQGLSTILTNEKFMKKNKNNPFWLDAADFISKRQTFAMAYQALADNDSRKSDFKDFYLLSVEQRLSTYHPRLQEIIKRYFEEDNLKVVG